MTTAPRAASYRSVPGFESALLWTTPAQAGVGQGTPRDDSPQASFVPPMSMASTRSPRRSQHT